MKHRLSRVLLVTLFGLALRLAAVVGAGTLRLPEQDWERGFEVGAVARALADGRGFSDPFMVATGPTACVGPLVPAAWAVLLELGRPGLAWRVMVLVNVLASAAIAPMLFVMVRCAVDDARAGFVAALAWACHPLAIAGPVGYQGTSGLFALSVTVVIWRMLALEKDDGEWRDAALLGAAVGGAFWIEPLLVPFLLAHPVVALVRRRFRVAVTSACALLMGCVLVAPWVIRNATVVGTPALRSWAGPEILMGAMAGPGEPTPTHIHPTRNADELARMQDAGEVAYASEKMEQAVALIRERPARWVASAAWRAANFYFGRVGWWRVASSHPIVGGFASALRGAVFAALAIAGFAGLWRIRREHAIAAGMFGLLMLTYPVTYALTHVEARYRLPIEPILTACAVLGAFSWWEARQNARVAAAVDAARRARA